MRRGDGATLALGLTALVSPHVLLALGLTFAAGGICLVARDTSRWERAALAVALAGLGTATWLMATIIGPLPATYGALRDGPIGDPAARLLMLLLATPVTVYLFDWRLIPAAIALLGRIGMELLPAGVLLWQGIAMPAALLFALVALRRHRGDLAAVAIGGFGLWSGSLLGRVGGAAALGSRVLVRRPETGEGAGGGDLATLLVVAGTIVALAGSLRIQFVYTVAFAVLLLVALVRRWMR